MADGGTITYNFKGNDTDVKNKLGDIKSKFKSAGLAIGKAFAVGTGAAITAISALTKKSVDAYAEYEQLAGGIESLFKGDEKSIKKVMQTSEKAYQDLTMSQNQYLNAFNSSYSIIKNGLGEEADAIEYTNKMISMSTDLYNTYGGSVENYQGAINWALKGTYSYLDNLNVGIKGTKEGFIEAANKSGILKKQIKDTSELTNDQILDVIQHYVEAAGALGKTQDEAAGTIQGSMNMMKSSWENLISGFAKDDADLSKLLDQFISSASIFGKNLLPVIQKVLLSIVKILPKTIAEIAKGLPKALNELLPPLINSALQLVKGLVSAIPMILQVLIAYLPTLIQMLIDMMFSIVNALIGMLPTLIPMLINAIIEGILTILDNVDLLVDTGIQLLMALIDGILNAIPTLVAKVPQIIIKLRLALWRQLPKLVSAGFEIIKKLWSGIFKAIPWLVKNAPTIIKNLVNEIKNGISKFVDVGKDLIGGLWKGIEDKWNGLKDKVSGFGKGIVSKFKKVFGIKSPSKEFAVIGKFNMLGLEKGMEDMQPQIQRTIDGMFSLSPNMNGAMNTMLSPNINVINNIDMKQDALGQMVNQVKTFSGGAKNDFNYGMGR